MKSNYFLSSDLYKKNCSDSIWETIIDRLDIDPKVERIIINPQRGYEKLITEVFIWEDHFVPPTCETVECKDEVNLELLKKVESIQSPVTYNACPSDIKIIYDLLPEGRIKEDLKYWLSENNTTEPSLEVPETKKPYWKFKNLFCISYYQQMWNTNFCFPYNGIKCKQYVLKIRSNLFFHLDISDKIVFYKSKDGVILDNKGTPISRFDITDEKEFLTCQS